MKVLIVDDSALMRGLLRRGLRQAGFDATAVEAKDGADALAKLAAERVDLILCDWNMPNMDGLAFIREVRKSLKTPLVMITTEATEAKMSTAQEAGATGYLTKPFTPETLKSTIGPIMKGVA